MNGKKVGLLRDSYQNEEFEQRQDEKFSLSGEVL